MPSYDFRCLDCKARFEVFLTYQEYSQKPVHCTRCGSANVQRRINRVRVVRSDHSRLASMADPAALDALDEDPRSLGRMMREMRSEVGEEMGPEFDEVVHRLESGQSPEQIEKELPELAESAGGMGDDSGGMGDFGGFDGDL